MYSFFVLLTEGCEGVSLSIEGTVISGVVEVINCKDAKVFIRKNVPTLQIDGSQLCHVEFEFDSFLENIFTAKSKDISASLKGGAIHQAHCSDGRYVSFPCTA